MAGRGLGGVGRISSSALNVTSELGSALAFPLKALRARPSCVFWGKALSIVRRRVRTLSADFHDRIRGPPAVLRKSRCLFAMAEASSAGRTAAKSQDALRGSASKMQPVARHIRAVAA